MKIKIISLKEYCEDIKLIQDFLFENIKNEYGYGYIPEYHQDIVNLKNYYKDPSRNNLFIALKLENNEIIGTIAIREYDKNFEEFENVYSKDFTSSIWRLFVNKKYRRYGIGTKLVNIVEEFAKEKNYKEIYLHTHKNVKGALDFWKSLNYEVTLDTNNELKTVHMIKNISSLNVNSKVNSEVSILN
ncbi:GNAT family N-acetyltransferase [Methanobrevibacter sp. OttesenSCG-928-K11]|nr:GNAT family N-acetyltransferase [Methanobrevibacter sp. OttesenSCG-928-K11]MDL2271055.1 GNAT family N-acetyltransferase [Methanobrevibacter sp. OttesenSCG-928-I08]